MRTSQAAKYARWAAITAASIVVMVALVYAWRLWQVREASKNAPAPVAQNVQQQSGEFAFSKVEGDRTVFTVRAAQATEFKEGGRAQLRDVWITIYGRNGNRNDNLHTKECDYAPATGRVTCAGEVQIDLQSAEDAKRAPAGQDGARVVHIGTSNIVFERETGDLTTDRDVHFRFPSGYGRGTGVRYSSREAAVRLQRDVEITLTNDAKRIVEPTTITGSAMEFTRESRLMRLHGPVRVKQNGQQMAAGGLNLQFDEELRAQTLTATGRPQIQLAQPGGARTLAADSIVAQLGREGQAQKITAQGNVQGLSKGAREEQRLFAQHAELEMAPGNQPRLLTARGSVKLATSGAGQSQRIETDALQLSFAAARGGSGSEIQRGESLAPAVVESRIGGETTLLRAARLSAEFSSAGRISQLTGRDGVEIQRSFANQPPQRSASQEFAMKFDSAGQWSEVEQRGNVKFREQARPNTAAGERTAQAQRARIVRASDTITLTGEATVADAVSRTTANSIVIQQRSGEVRADGNVRTSYLQSPSPSSARAGNLPSPAFANQPAHLSAELLRADRDSGRAIYSGRARLWQGDAVIEAGSIELQRVADSSEPRLEARGSVRAIFPQGGSGQPVAGRSAKEESQNRRQDAGATKVTWRVRSGSLSYRPAQGSGEATVRLEESVFAESSVGQIQSAKLEVFLSTATSLQAEQSKFQSGVSKLLATGGVSVKQGDRRGTAERAEYVPAEGKFVLSGGQPTLYDAVLGMTTGRQLTFFLADDRIIVDSAEGTRTVTRHRVGQ